MKSAFAGVAVVVTAILAVAGVAFLLQILTVSTVNVSAGTVYNVVLVAAARSAVPNLPVGIIYSPCLYLCYCKK
jgi:hypothetical protein